MHLGISFNQIFEARGIAAGLLLPQWIAPGIDLAPQLFGPFPRRRCRPFRPASDGHPPLPTSMTVIDSEGPAAGSVDADGEAPHIGIENLIVPPLGRFGLADRFFVQAQSVDHELQRNDICCAVCEF